MPVGLPRLGKHFFIEQKEREEGLYVLGACTLAGL